MRGVLLAMLVCLTWLAGWAVPDVEPPDSFRPSLMRCQQAGVAQRLRLPGAARRPVSRPAAIVVAPPTLQVEKPVLIGPRAPPA